MRLIIWFALVLAFGLAVDSAESSGTPVIAELFTSEGCSSCPPADALLDKFDRAQPVPNVHIIVLSEHVDYWNNLGWQDPFSSHQYSERQATYARRFGLDGAYTPQLVVDGKTELVGSDSRGASAAVSRAASGLKTPVRITSATREGSNAVITIEAGTTPHRADLWIAITGDRYTSAVRRGENTGRTLSHVSVVHTLKNIGDKRTARIPIDAKWTSTLRVIAFLQERNQGPIVGAAASVLPSP